MKIALIGYGAMGKVVRRVAEERGHEVVVIVDPGASKNSDKIGAATYQELSAEALNGVEVAIDFSQAEGLLNDVQICRDAGVNLVMGTTGWYEQMDEVKKVVGDGNIGFLWSSNFSIGVNLYFKIVDYASKLMNKFDEYDIWGHEMHHYNKADSPSGTAKTLEKILLDNVDRKDSVVEDRLDRKREDNEIHFSSVRGGPVNFGHAIGFDSEADTITINHAARSRDGYAVGAVQAAEWIVGKKGFFGMEDFLKDVLK